MDSACFFKEKKVLQYNSAVEMIKIKHAVGGTRLSRSLVMNIFFTG
jgi:hypothetical protein